MEVADHSTTADKHGLSTHLGLSRQTSIPCFATDETRRSRNLAQPSRLPPLNIRPTSKDSPSLSAHLHQLQSQHPSRLPCVTLARDRSDIAVRSEKSKHDLSAFFVDLTEYPITMPQGRRRRSFSKERVSRGSGSSFQANKRRRVEPADSSIEEVDLRDVDSGSDIVRVLERQRAATVKEQQLEADKPMKLARVTCVVCMEEMTNMTATLCGHLFCHTCLMEALIAGENQAAEPGKGPSKCPICRKKIKRPKDSKESGQVIPLEIKVISRQLQRKGKERIT